MAVLPHKPEKDTNTQQIMVIGTYYIHKLVENIQMEAKPAKLHKGRYATWKEPRQPVKKRETSLRGNRLTPGFIGLLISCVHCQLKGATLSNAMCKAVLKPPLSFSCWAFTSQAVYTRSLLCVEPIVPVDCSTWPQNGLGKLTGIKNVKKKKSHATWVGLKSSTQTVSLPLTTRGCMGCK